MGYVRTQRAPIWLILAFFCVAAAAGAWQVRSQAPVAIALAGGAAAMLFLSLSFQTLTVADEGEALAVRFGPLPVFRKRIAYAAVTHVEPAHTALIDGWGIHFIPGRGWTWNLWGRDCVLLTVSGRTMRIGTDDAENLAAFIRTKIGA